MRKRGFTFVELLVASLIASITIGATVIAISHIFYFTELAFNTTVIVSDIRDIIEEIWCTPFNAIVANFPHQVVDGPPSNSYSAIVGGYSLINERIVVEYPDVNADPLEIAVTARWTDSRGRNSNIQLSTFKTR